MVFWWWLFRRGRESAPSIAVHCCQKNESAKMKATHNRRRWLLFKSNRSASLVSMIIYCDFDVKLREMIPMVMVCKSEVLQVLFMQFIHARADLTSRRFTHHVNRQLTSRLVFLPLLEIRRKTRSNQRGESLNCLSPLESAHCWKNSRRGRKTRRDVNFRLGPSWRDEKRVGRGVGLLSKIAWTSA